MVVQLFTLEDPLCALEAGGARETSICRDCGRGHRRQIGNLEVALVCRPRHVWLSSVNAVLLDPVAESTLASLSVPGIDFRQTVTSWRPGMPWADEPPPTLVQLVAENPIAAASQSVRSVSCSCGAVESISFNPLIVQQPSEGSRVWHLAENPEILILDSTIRDGLVALDQDLDFEQVWLEGEYEVPTSFADGIDWGDL